MEHTLPNCIHTLLTFRQTEVQSGVLGCLFKVVKRTRKYVLDVCAHLRMEDTS
jgi:hypothetical protein